MPTSSAQPPDPSLLRMSAPLVVSFTMRSAFTLVDSFYAATIADSAVAAIGLTMPFEFLMIALWVGMSTGLTSTFSRAIGAGETRRADQYLRCTWTFVRIAVPAFAAVGVGIWFLWPRGDLTADTFHDFRIYGTTLIVGSAFTSFWSVVPDSIVKAYQDTRSTMIAGITSNVINVVLNTVFVFVFHWGVFGIAFSTVLGRIGGLAYALGRARHHEHGRAKGPDAAGQEDPAPYRSLFALAVPSSLTFALMSTETAVINRILAGFEHSTASLAAYSNYYRVTLFALQPVIATGIAMLPFAARRFGRGDVEGVRHGIRQALTACSAYALLVVGPVMLFGAPFLARRLADAPLAVRYTTFGLRVAPLVCVLSAPFLLARPVFEGMQRGSPGLVMAAIRYLVLTLPLAWGGSEIARIVGQPPMYGLIAGLAVAAAVSSAAFYGWLRAALPSGEADQASSRFNTANRSRNADRARM